MSATRPISSSSCSLRALLAAVKQQSGVLQGRHTHTHTHTHTLSLSLSVQPFLLVPQGQVVTEAMQRYVTDSNPPPFSVLHAKTLELAPSYSLQGRQDAAPPVHLPRRLVSLWPAPRQLSIDLLAVPAGAPLCPAAAAAARAA